MAKSIRAKFVAASPIISSLASFAVTVAINFDCGVTKATIIAAVAKNMTRQLAIQEIATMPNGWPIFAQWEAQAAALQALPQYGGNTIPDAYLDSWAARQAAYMRRIGATPIGDGPIDAVELPARIDQFMRLL